MHISFNICFLQRLVPLTVYCIVIAIQREHLFIWSVFAPKLLYEFFHTLVCLFMITSIVVLECVDYKLGGL